MAIEQHAAALERLVSRNQDIEELASGFGGDMGPAEGPVWRKEGGYLLFSGIHHNRRVKWTPVGGRRSLMSLPSTPRSFGEALGNHPGGGCKPRTSPGEGTIG
jgi:sugar lactone lactonase YvrE